MGRLLSAADVERLAREGRDVVVVGPDALLSPLAVDRARELGVRVERGTTPQGGPRSLEDEVRDALLATVSQIGERDIAEVVRQTVAAVRSRRQAPTAPPVGPILDGRVAVVTGGSSGIGAATALALSQAGAKVAVGSFKGDPHDPKGTREAIERAGGQCIVVDADVTSTREVDRAFDKAASTWGRVDIAVANAGILRRDALADLDDERWRAVLDVDLGGVLRTARAAAGRMGHGGAIVCVSSIAGGIFGWAEHAHYAAAKSGMLGFTRSLAAELGPAGIRVNAVLPGLIETPQSLDAENSVGAAGLSAAAASVPLGRIGTAADVASVIRFLVSDEAAYLTGQAVVVDGGVSTALAL